MILKVCFQAICKIVLCLKCHDFKWLVLMFVDAELFSVTFEQSRLLIFLLGSAFHW